MPASSTARARAVAEVWHNIAVAQCEESLTAVVHQVAEGDCLIADLHMVTGAVLQYREDENQTEGPNAQEKQQRDGTEVAEEAFPSASGFDHRAAIFRHGIQVRR